MATLKPGFKLPEPEPGWTWAASLTAQTSDGFRGWEIVQVDEHGDAHDWLDEWPFIESTASREDFERIGIEVI